MAPIPSGDDQLVFLTKMQRLFDRGSFTSTYKYALVIALADLCVEREADADGSLRIELSDIADRVIDLFWDQVAPFGEGRLEQSAGHPGAIIAAIRTFRDETALATAYAARRDPRYAQTRSEVRRILADQPVTYLQNFDGGADRFLFEPPTGGVLVLKSGVAWCMRRFHGLVTALARAGWVAKVKALPANRPLLGDRADVEDFLFAPRRANLVAFGAALRAIDGPLCHYCGTRVDAADIDHFIPFSLYRRDIAHNLVRAHPACNRSKSNALAGARHLDAWLDRLHHRGDAIGDLGLAFGLAVEPATLLAVARWAYANAQMAGATVWNGRDDFAPIDDRMLAALRA